jgi:hypothetical protein
MQIACHRCGAMLDEGTAFCPACGAPQIRVSPEQATPPMPPGTPGDLQPPAMPVALEGPVAIDWKRAMPAILGAAAIGAVPSWLPIISLGCCLWLTGAGALAVLFYSKRTAGSGIITVGAGARLGAVTGLCAFLIVALLHLLGTLVTGAGKVKQVMLESLRRSAAGNPDPNAQQILARMSTPEGLALLVTVMVVGAFFVFVIFGIAGGALGASLWGRRKTS